MAAAAFPEACVHHLVARQASRIPGSLAVLHGSGSVSFGELDERAARLAGYLQSAGVKRGSRVGVGLPSSPDLVAALLAIFKAGASFVPLDAAWPRARLEHILRDAGVALALCGGAFREALDGAPLRLVSVEEAGGGPPCREAAASPQGEACVLYTSGSTGLPKGVLRTHRAIVSRLAWSACGPGDVWCHNMPLGAGFSQERLFVPLMRGEPLAVVPDEAFTDMALLAGEVQAHGITELTLVPVVLRRLLQLSPADRERLRSVRTFNCGGAELTPDLARSFAALFPYARLINAYGTTETGSVIRGPVDTPGAISIGRPVANVEIVLLDGDGRPVAPGEAGVLCVQAPSLARGYLNLPALTEERFTAGGALYRTGDLARVLDSGVIQLLGRTDRQVKVRGFRVELGEIEAALCRLPFVAEAIVTCREERLRAYVAARPGAATAAGEVRSRLRPLLPDHMLPHSVTVLERLPRGFNGKVDLNALPEPTAARPGLVAAYLAPRDATESAIAAIWERVLGIEGIGVYDHFIELGGDSLSLLRAITEMRERLGMEVPVELMAGAGTVAAVAAHAGAAR